MELRTARLSLAPLDPDRDAEALHAAYSDPAVMRWWNTPLRTGIADTHRDLVNSLEGEGACMWVLREAGVGRGIMTEAAGAVVEYAFGLLGLDRVEPLEAADG